MTSLAFALSGTVMGATNTGVNFFLLVYYNQVIGLHVGLAGLALGLALLIDGIADPLVGILSDRIKSPWGRRHPFIIAAIIPMAVSYVALWYPPFGADQQHQLFGYLLALTVILRLSISLFDIPTNALIPELTQDYEQRTKYSAAKTSLNWMTANLVGIVMYGVFLNDMSGQPSGSGVLRETGYKQGAIWIGGLVLIFSTLVPWSLRGWVPYLARLQTPKTSGVTKVLREVFETYANRSILALLVSAVFFAAGVGLTQALWVYLLSFYWALSAFQVNAVQFAYLLAALTSWWILPLIAKKRDKRKLFLILSSVFWLNDVAPIALRLAGLMPPNGSDALTVALVGFGFVDGVLFNMVITMILSMLSDVVEDNLARTGRREEGVVLAGQTLVTKASTALGTVLGAALPSEVPPETLRQLGLWFVPLMWTLGILSTLAMLRYAITREGFERNSTQHANNEP
jgi:glycoside/pentoside/hexuronide:cation symporter, GPH family